MPPLPRRHALAAISRRELQVANTYRSYYAMTLVLGLMNVTIYFMISETFASTRPGGIGDAPSFFAFAAVGLILSSVLYLGINGLAQRVQEEQLTGSLGALMAEPVRAGELAIGLAGVSVAIALCQRPYSLFSPYWCSPFRSKTPIRSELPWSPGSGP